MENKASKYLISAVCLLLVCLFGYYAGTYSSRNAVSAKDEQIADLLKKQGTLQEFNRGAISKLDLEGKVYVIGHKSPDSDTVCTAIAYARLLNMLGYEAEPAIAGAISNETKMILEEAGVETPKELVDASGENIFLVDHSEYAQAVPGLEDAHIVGVIDHHGIGNVSTGNLVFYQARPIGATATIVWLDYLNYGLEIDQKTASVLLSAILSDTYNFTASTTTDVDKAAVEELKTLAGVEDIEALYHRIHEAALSYEGFTDEEIFFSDYKEYEASGVKFGIGLASAIDEEVAAEIAERMKAVLPEIIKKTDVDLMYISVGMRENGQKIDRVVPADERSEEMLKAAFPDYDEYDGTSYIYRTGIGRKTIFVPGLTDYLAAHPHE